MLCAKLIPLETFAVAPIARSRVVDEWEDRRELQRFLQQNAPIGRQTEAKLAKCLLTVLDNPGSLFRCELAYRSARAQRLSDHQAKSSACALEYFHVASLLLDDLPLMDDSMERRGRICPHLLYGEGIAILAALALITRAYGLLGEAISQSGLEHQRAAHALIERCLGSAGVVNGQARDLGFKAGPGGGREAKQIALQKTVPLIELALVLPAILAGAERVQVRQLRRLSICWGLLYQGIDDLMDLSASTALSGKSSGRDETLGRPNVARSLGRFRVKSYLDRLAQVAQASISDLLKEAVEWRFLQVFHDGLKERRLALSAL